MNERFVDFKIAKRGMNQQKICIVHYHLNAGTMPANRRIEISILLIISILISAAIGYHYYEISGSAIPNKNTETTGLIIPLYFDPNGSWDYLLEIHQQFPKVPIMVIMNPDNGPGQNFSSDYLNWTQKMEGLGILVLGYIYTSYGNRSIDVVKNQTMEYLEWYHVNGIFLDEVSDNASYGQYYENITDMCRSTGAEYIAGNPGTSVPSGITKYFNITVLYENPGVPPAANISNIVNGTPRSGSAIICYDIESLDESTVEDISNYFSYVYFTNYGMPDPYESLPVYLCQEASILSNR